MRASLLLLALAASAHGAASPLILPARSQRRLAGGCSLTADYVDDGGAYSRIADAGGALTVFAVSPEGWGPQVPGAFDATSMSGWVNFGAANNLTFTAVAGCSALRFSNGETWTVTQPVANISTVHVVFMTHLDVGFTLLARDVCEQYFQEHLPNGIKLSQALRAAGGPAQYSVTTHPWLLQEFLDGAAQCAHTPRTPAQIAEMEAAIADGDVRWHGKPMNNFVELEDEPWFATSLRMSDVLNARYNTTHGNVCCKSTDVPGLSKSAIPALAAAGKKAIHLGYNSACRVPDIPQAFLWTHEETATQLLTFVNNNYGSEIIVPGSAHALSFHYSPDNSGPPTSVQEVQSYWAQTQARFPNATLVLSSLDDFTLAILPIAETLPQVTGEIGQSWLYGAPADPAKVAAFRAARRVRNDAVSAGWLDASDPDLYNYERRLWVGGPEHNWGLSFGGYVPGARSASGNWSNQLFHPLRFTDPRYVLYESSNIEKRAFTLPLPPPAGASAGYLRYLDALVDEAAALTAAAPDLSAYSPVPASQTFASCGRFASLRFSAADGSIASLVDAQTNFEWVAAGTLGLAAFHYRTYDEADFNRWNAEYNPGCGPPCGDFAKQGMDSASPESKSWAPSLTQLYQLGGVAPGGGCAFAAALALPAETVTKYGGMSGLFLLYEIDTDASAPAPSLRVELRWLNKTATRMAESAWLSFVPALSATPGGGDMTKWRMDVLGHGVSPLEVVDMGTRHVHAVWKDVSFDDLANGGPFVSIAPLDTPLVSPGDAEHLLFYDGMAQPDMTGGWHFDVASNVWGTAFPQWYGDSGKARFSLSLQAPAKA